jgi:hypothetical protein
MKQIMAGKCSRIKIAFAFEPAVTLELPSTASSDIKITPVIRDLCITRFCIIYLLKNFKYSFITYINGYKDSKYRNIPPT